MSYKFNMDTLPIEMRLKIFDHFSIDDLLMYTLTSPTARREVAVQFVHYFLHGGPFTFSDFSEIKMMHFGSEITYVKYKIRLMDHAAVLRYNDV